MALTVRLLSYLLLPYQGKVVDPQVRAVGIHQEEETQALISKALTS
jgi:hypothetical protein